MKTTAQTISLWVSLVFGAILLGALLLFPGFFPPMSPKLSADRVANFYADHKERIRASMIIVNFCGVMLIPFFMVIVHQMKRMATPTPVLAYSYLSVASSSTALFAVADLFWLIAAFRPERDPQQTVLLNDIAWIVFTAPVGMIVAQNLCLALAVHLDSSPTPVLPRWVAPFSVVTALAIAPAACAAVLQSGPLAWNGAISFWLRISAYGVYILVMFVVLRAAVKREAAEEALTAQPALREAVAQ